MFFNRTPSYQASADSTDAQDDGDFVLSQKKCVVQFILTWYELEPDKFNGSLPISQFIEVCSSKGFCHSQVIYRLVAWAEIVLLYTLVVK